MTKIEMARCYGHMDHSGVLNNIITDVEMHYNNMVVAITNIEKENSELKQTIAGLMDSVSKLEIMALDSIINLMKSYDSKSLNLKNLDTKKEHALRLQLRDTKEQFKQLEEAHRKLVKSHKTLQKSYTEKEVQWNNLSDALIRRNEEFDVIAQDRAKLADDYRGLQGKFSAVLQEEMQVNKILWEENRKLKGVHPV